MRITRREIRRIIREELSLIEQNVDPEMERIEALEKAVQAIKDDKENEPDEKDLSGALDGLQSELEKFSKSIA
tara:strand:+ start:746 stop:964 length:219 start_codon:yes stop_codon:yes gene_type:complete